ncbi:MAG: hypothetical protein ACYDAL_06945 [Candidatus Dormibacteraceae bacterium]
MVALTLILLAGAAGAFAHRGGGLDAAPQHVAAQSAAQSPSSTAASAAGALSIGSRVSAAVKAAETAPHGGIGTAAVATKP